MGWEKPKEVSDATFYYPARVVGTLLPPIKEIPADFKDLNNKWCRLASQIFFSGGRLPPVKDGVDATAAHRHISSILASYEPDHNHKIYGAAYLMSLFYEAKP